MRLSDLPSTPIFELDAPQALYRVQQIRSRKGTLRIGRVRLSPPGLLAWRFDLSDTPVGYFALAPVTALYEAVCRRETMGVSLQLLAARSLVHLRVSQRLQLVDLRAMSSAWPVLQSMRFSHTQRLAADAFELGFAGIIYRSAQQANMDCIALFGKAISTLKWIQTEPLVESGTGGLHETAAAALRGSLISLLGVVPRYGQK